MHVASASQITCPHVSLTCSALFTVVNLTLLLKLLLCLQVRVFSIESYLHDLGYTMPLIFQERFEQDKVMLPPGHPMLQYWGVAKYG